MYEHRFFPSLSLPLLGANGVAIGGLGVTFAILFGFCHKTFRSGIILLSCLPSTGISVAQAPFFNPAPQTGWVRSHINLVCLIRSACRVNP